MIWYVAALVASVLGARGLSVQGERDGGEGGAARACSGVCAGSGAPGGGGLMGAPGVAAGLRAGVPHLGAGGGRCAPPGRGARGFAAAPGGFCVSSGVCARARAACRAAGRAAPLYLFSL